MNFNAGPSGLGDLLYAFGSGRRGQLGTSLDSSRKSIAVPHAIHGFKDDEMIAVSANGDHSALLSGNFCLPIFVLCGHNAVIYCSQSTSADLFILLHQLMAICTFGAEDSVALQIVISLSSYLHH